MPNNKILVSHDPILNKKFPSALLPALKRDLCFGNYEILTDWVSREKVLHQTWVTVSWNKLTIRLYCRLGFFYDISSAPHRTYSEDVVVRVDLLHGSIDTPEITMALLSA